MPTNTTVSSYIITRLKQAGIEHVFAVPGDYASPFLITLDSTPGIKRIPNINELGVGYAADGYARFKGAGAACVQYGVGSFSMLNCAAGSWVERVPVAVISASPATKDRHPRAHRGNTLSPQHRRLPGRPAGLRQCNRRLRDNTRSRNRAGADRSRHNRNAYL